MSPEQIDGSKTLDARSDLWSLGVLAYEALTGQTCFGRGSSMTELLISISTLEYTPPSRVRREVPKAIDAWLGRVLATRPEDRFSSVAEMAHEFRRALGRPRGVPRAVWVVAAAALLIASCVVALLTLRSPGPESDTQTTSATSKPTASPVAPPKGAPSIPPDLTSTPATPPVPSPLSPPSPRGKPAAIPQATAAPSATTSAKARPRKENDPSDTL